MQPGASNVIVPSVGSAYRSHVLGSPTAAWFTWKFDGTAFQEGGPENTIVYSYAFPEDVAPGAHTLTFDVEDIRGNHSSADLELIVCGTTLSTDYVVIDADGGSQEITVTATDSQCAWTATTDTEWIAITSGSSGTGNGKLVFSVAHNTEISSRYGYIYIAGQYITVYQKGLEYSLITAIKGEGNGYTSGSWSNAEIGSYGFYCDSTASCTEKIPAGAEVSLSSVPNDGSYFYGWGNSLCDDDNASCSFKMNKDTTITPGFNQCTYTLSATSATFDAEGATGTFEVTAPDEGCGWTAECYESWITVYTGSTYGNGTVSYNVAENTDSSSRSGVIVVGGNSFTVTQDRSMITTQCPAEYIFGVDSINSGLLRQFRDDVLMGNNDGKMLAKLYYEHSSELIQIMKHNPAIKTQVARVLLMLMPDIAEMIQSGKIEVRQQAIEEIAELCNVIGAEASPDLKEDIERFNNDFLKGGL